MSITQKHISEAYGALPLGSRLPTPAASLVSQTLSTAMPALTPAAGRVVAQHLHNVAKHDPHRGTADAIEAIADDLGADVSEFRGPELMERAVHENHPLPAFLSEACRLTKHEEKERSARADHKKMMHEDERHHEARFGKSDHQHHESSARGGKKKKASGRSRAEVAAAKRELIEIAEAEGGFDFGSFSRGAASNPFAQMAAQMAAQKLLGGGEVGGFNLFKHHDRIPRKTIFGVPTHQAPGGARESHAAEELMHAMKAHKGKLTKKDQVQALLDLESQRSRKSGAKGGVKKSTLYDAFRA